jgi:hypothetical protein
MKMMMTWTITTAGCEFRGHILASTNQLGNCIVAAHVHPCRYKAALLSA